MACTAAVVAISSGLCACEPVKLAGSRQGIHRGRQPNSYPESSSTAVLLVDTGYGFEPTCSGTLVGRRAVVSAAHCFEDGGGAQLRVAFGPDGVRGRGAVRIADVRLADDEVDVALVKLREDAPAHAQPVPILPENLSLQRNDRVSVAGYGLDERDEAGELRATDGQVADIRRYGDTIGAFTVGHFGGRGPCNGDSGGPVYVYKSEGVFLVGAVSGPDAEVSRCGNEYVLYGYVPGQLDWIRREAEIATAQTSGKRRATALAVEPIAGGGTQGAHLRAEPRMLAELDPDRVCAVPASSSFTFRTLAQHGRFLQIQLDPSADCPSWTQAFIYEPSFSIEAVSDDDGRTSGPGTGGGSVPGTGAGGGGRGERIAGPGDAGRRAGDARAAGASPVTQATARAAEPIGATGARGAHLRAAPRMLAELGPAQLCAIPADGSITFRAQRRHGEFLEIQLESASDCPSWRRAFIYLPSFTVAGGAVPGQGIGRAGAAAGRTAGPAGPGNEELPLCEPGGGAQCAPGGASGDAGARGPLEEARDRGDGVAQEEGWGEPGQEGDWEDWGEGPGQEGDWEDWGEGRAPGEGAERGGQGSGNAGPAPGRSRAGRAAEPADAPAYTRHRRWRS
jgi:V8-like Glu-specific endopeptidase